MHYVDSDEGIWNSGRPEDEYRGPNLGHRPRHKQGYFPPSPVDTLQDLRTDAVLKMVDAGIDIEVHHHEVATAGQGEIDMRFTSMTKMADWVMLHKYILKNVAYMQGKVATFMPKPLYGENGNGMHTHMSLFKGERNAFYNPKDPDLLSRTAKYYIAGLLKHASEMTLITNQWVNSYKRLVPGYEAPIYKTWATVSRSDLVRVPAYKPGKESAMRVEYRSPDPACNPYLAFAVMLSSFVALTLCPMLASRIL